MKRKERFLITNAHGGGLGFRNEARMKKAQLAASASRCAALPIGTRYTPAGLGGIVVNRPLAAGYGVP